MKGERRRKISLQSSTHGPNATVFSTSFPMMHNLVPSFHIRLPLSTGSIKSICTIHIVKQWCRPQSAPSMGPDVIESRRVWTVWKYGLNYSLQGSHKPRALCIHTHIPILQVKLKSDYSQCVLNVLFSKHSFASSASLFRSPTGRPLQKPALRFSCYRLIDWGSLRWGEVDGDGVGGAWQSYATEATESLMWEPLADSAGGSMEAYAGCAAWTNKALCVLELMPLLPCYHFQEWFTGDDISNKQSTLVSSWKMETAALNYNNFSIHPLWLKTQETTSFIIFFWQTVTVKVLQNNTNVIFKHDLKRSVSIGYCHRSSQGDAILPHPQHHHQLACDAWSVPGNAPWIWTMCRGDN